jgi:hypothetical protein
VLSGRNNTLKHGHISLEQAAKIIRLEFFLTTPFVLFFFFIYVKPSQEGRVNETERSNIADHFFADQYIVYCFRKKRRKNGKKEI